MHMHSVPTTTEISGIIFAMWKW